MACALSPSRIILPESAAQESRGTVRSRTPRSTKRASSQALTGWENRAVTEVNREVTGVNRGGDRGCYYGVLIKCVTRKIIE